MKKITILLMFLSAILTFQTRAFACSSDDDCSIGSRCSRAPESLTGVCVGGMDPDISYDLQPVAPRDYQGNDGNTCTYDIECGSNAQCIKWGGIYGTCMKTN